MKRQKGVYMGIEIINTKYETKLTKITLEREIKIREAKLDFTDKALTLCNSDIDDLVKMLYELRFGEQKESKSELKDVVNELFDDLEQLEKLTYDKNKLESEIKENKEILERGEIE